MSRTPRPCLSVTPSGIGRLALAVSALLVAGQLATMPIAAAALPPAPLAAATFVDLGSSATYSVLGGTGVVNTGAGTALSGDLGLSPSGAISGFPLGTYAGELHDKDGAAATAQADRAVAYQDAAAQTSTSTFSGDLAGARFLPGVHTTAAASNNTGTITLDADGDPSAVFVFQIGAAMGAAAGSKVVLTDGALANNVFWQASGAVTLGAGAQYVGTLLGAGAITLADGASLKGRALSPDTISLTNSPLTRAVDDLDAPVVTIDGGPARSINDPTPPIHGTTDEAAGTPVQVTVAGQDLSTTVGVGGAWSVSVGTLSPGAHDVVVSVTDASRNVGTAHQVLTIDVTAPVVTIDGGARRATHSTTPEISGTTNETGGSMVTVAVDGQTLTTMASPEGIWTVHAAALAEAPHSVTASATDAAQNTGTGRQILSVDFTVPVVTIDGGATRATDDTSPWTYGTTAEQAGTTVDVSVGGQVLSATVLRDGTWGVSATTLSAGTYTVLASVTDAAQNTGTATQTITVGPMAPPTPDPPVPVPTDPVPVPTDPVPVPAPTAPAPAPPAPQPSYQPDAAIGLLHGALVGAGSYDTSRQRVTKKLRGKRRHARFKVRVTNRGDTIDRMTIRGTPKNRKFKVTYTAGGQNVTPAVTSGTYLTSPLAPGASTVVIVRLTRTKSAGTGDRRAFQIRTGSSHDRAMRDTVSAVVRAS